MPVRVRVWVDSSEAPPGSVAVLYGPDVAGNVDYSFQERVSEPVAASPGEDAWSPASGYHNGPAGMGPAGEETRAVSLLSRPLVFGHKTFGIKWRDRQTEELSSPTTVTAFVNALPGMVRELGCYENLTAGRVKFSFVPGVLI